MAVAGGELNAYLIGGSFQNTSVPETDCNETTQLTLIVITCNRLALFFLSESICECHTVQLAFWAGEFFQIL
jgi:hypothetical protein